MRCGHTQMVPCSADPSRSSCEAPCERKLQYCDHLCSKKCGEQCEAPCGACQKAVEAENARLKAAAIANLKARAASIQSEEPRLVAIEADSDEFQAHSSDILSSLRPPKGWKIERVQVLQQIHHPDMHSRWLKCQASLRDPMRRPQRACFLSSEKHIQTILNQKKVPNKSPSTYSFAPIDPESGTLVELIVCDVLVGSTLIINSTAVKKPRKPGAQYDSVWWDMPDQGSTNITPASFDAILPTFVCALVMIPVAAANSSWSVPSNWQQQNRTLQLIDIPRSGQEFRKVSGLFNETMPGTQIDKIERVQNTYLWQVFQSRKSLLALKNNNASQELDLFHGTSSTPPNAIYDNDDGFDMRYSNPGMWGKGIYFAKNASYSHNYASQTSAHRQMFLATVLVGDCINRPPDSNIKVPPHKSKGSLQTSVEKYDSISGHTNGSDVWILYENGRAYPSYLISYK